MSESAGQRASRSRKGGFACQLLLRPVVPGEAVVEELATRKTGFQRVPVGDRHFALQPAKENYAVVQLEGEVQQPLFQVLNLHANRIDLRQRIAGFRHGLLVIVFQARGRNDIHTHTSGEINRVRELLLPVFERGSLGGGGLGPLEERIHERKKRLGFLEGEGTHVAFRIPGGWALGNLFLPRNAILAQGSSVWKTDVKEV